MVTMLKAFPFKSLYYFPPHPEVSEAIGPMGLRRKALCPSGPFLDPYKEEASLDILYDLYTPPASRLQPKKLNKKGDTMKMGQ